MKDKRPVANQDKHRRPIIVSAQHIHNLSLSGLFFVAANIHVALYSKMFSLCGQTVSII